VKHFLAKQEAGLSQWDAAFRQRVSEFELLPSLKIFFWRDIGDSSKKLQGGNRTKRPAVAGAERKQESPVFLRDRTILHMAKDVRVEDGFLTQGFSP